MEVKILASGSKGNCIAVSSGSSVILIDAGVAKTKIQKRLLQHDINPTDVEAIFVTHAHGDHIKGLPFANEFRIPVYASEGEWKSIKSVDHELQMSVHESMIYLEDFTVTPFDVYHDALEPKGYAIKTHRGKCSVCLDTGHVSPQMLAAMSRSDVYVIEANHHPKMVEVCNRPESVKARILSNSVGHLSNQQTGEALAKLIKGKGERIYLTHLSESNNVSILAQMTVERHLSPFVNGKDYFLEVVR
ncbi:MBL fold metallo-hydrolase [Shouchella clausii]|uniref:MBL fold metallo-hydrolase n=1 Tax=Shouchella clausii TaxID=79880 RepID=UPI002898E4CB|nr:MBL fold metallo-hydrolase [Shouchella clausii]